MRVDESVLRRLIYEVLCEGEAEDYNVEFVSDKMFCYNDENAKRYIVIVKTKEFGNVAFYKRSGHGNADNLNKAQSKSITWLPFGGLATDIINVERENPVRGCRYTAWGADWLCKLPGWHSESDGTSKFLNSSGEFYKISLALTSNIEKFNLKEVEGDILIKKFFGKSREELQNLKSIDFKLFYDTERLYNAIAINYCLKSKGALQEKWLPPGKFVFTGSNQWGKNIGQDFIKFREYIKSR